MSRETSLRVSPSAKLKTGNRNTLDSMETWDTAINKHSIWIKPIQSSLNSKPLQNNNSGLHCHYMWHWVQSRSSPRNEDRNSFPVLPWLPKDHLQEVLHTTSFQNCQSQIIAFLTAIRSIFCSTTQTQNKVFPSWLKKVFCI